MKKKNAAGEDEIPNEAWVYGEQNLMDDTHKISNEIWNGKRKILKEWKTEIVTLVYKKRNKEKVKNYRGITQIGTGYKIYAEILKNRLEKKMKERKIISDTVVEYRKGKALFNLVSGVQ